MPEEKQSAHFRRVPAARSGRAHRARSRPRPVDRASGLAGCSAIRSRVRSQHGKGSVFFVEAPLGLASAQPAFDPGSSSVAPRAAGALSGLRVTAIDNEPRVLDGMKRLLEQWGCVVTAAPSLEGALRQLGAAPHVIVADYHLDDGDGLEAIAAIRSHFQVHVPGILATADRSAEVRDAARLLDVEVLNKPVKPAPLEGTDVALSCPGRAGGLGACGPPLRVLMADTPFDDIRDLLRALPEADETGAGGGAERQAALTKPAVARPARRDRGISRRLAGRQAPRRFAAGRHLRRQPRRDCAKACRRFRLPSPQAMVANFTGGGAAINQICKTFDIGLKVYELALEYADPRHHQGASARRARLRGDHGVRHGSAGSQPDLLCIGEMGIGNTTIAAAIYCALLWRSAGGLGWTGHRRRRRRVEAQGRGGARAPWRCTRRIWAIRWNCLRRLAAARSRRWRAPFSPRASTHARRARRLRRLLRRCGAARHRPPRARPLPGRARLGENRRMREVLSELGKEPLLMLGMRLGEGSGAALAIGVLRPRSLATTAWRPSRKPASPAKRGSRELRRTFARTTFELDFSVD